MSLGRSGKLTASLQQKQQQHQHIPKPHVPPLALQKPVAPLWRETDAALATLTKQSPVDPTTSAVASDSSFRWDVLLATSHQHGTQARPYRTGIDYPISRHDFTRPLTIQEMLPFDARVRPAPGATLGAMPRMHPPPSEAAIGLMANGEMMGAATSTTPTNKTTIEHGDGFIQHTQTRTHQTTTTTITQTQTSQSESITTQIPLKPRAVGDHGALVSYGSEDGPSQFTTHMLPSLRTSEREELKQLSEALDFFVSKLDTQRMKHLRLDDRNSVESLMGLLKEEQGVYDLFFDELIRQVSVQCKERGEMMGKIRGYYQNLLLRVPLHLYNIQAELAEQQKLNHTLQEEQRQMREQSFAIKVELGAYTHRFKETAHELEMHKDMLSRAEHEKDRARAMFTQFKEEWDHQRFQLEEQLSILKEEREDYLSTAAATATALQRSRNPNLLVHSLLDESDSDEERINARIAFLKDMAQDDDSDLLSATVLQIERDSQQPATETPSDARPSISTSNPLDAAAMAAVTELERKKKIAEERRHHQLTAKRAEALRQEKERVAALAVAALAPDKHGELARGSSPLLPGSSPVYAHGLSSLPDFQPERSQSGLLPAEFKKRDISSSSTSRKKTVEEKQAAAQRRELRALKRVFKNNKSMQEAKVAEVDTITSWKNVSSDSRAREEMVDKLHQQLPNLPRDIILRVSEDEKQNVSLPILLDFLQRIDSYPFNQHELLLIRARLPQGQVWIDGVRGELEKRGLTSVADDLFSKDNERKAVLSHLLADVSSTSSESETEQQPVTPTVTAPPQLLQPAEEGNINADIDTLMSLANPNASRSARNSLVVGSSVEVTEADGQASKLAKKLAREERRKKKGGKKVAKKPKGISTPTQMSQTDDESNASSTSSRSIQVTPTSASKSSSRRVSLSTRREQETESIRTLSRSSSKSSHRDQTASNTTSTTTLLRGSMKSSKPGYNRTNSSKSVDFASENSPGKLGKVSPKSPKVIPATSTGTPVVVNIPTASSTADSGTVKSARTSTNSSVDSDRSQSQLTRDELVAAAADDANSGTIGGFERESRSDDEDSLQQSTQPNIPRKEDLAHRRQTLPSLDFSEPNAAESKKLPKPIDIGRAKSINMNPPTTNQSTHTKPFLKVHHRHHSRAVSNMGSNHSSASNTPSLRPIMVNQSNQEHPLLTLSGEHYQAANDPRANDDHELIYRQNVEPSNTFSPTESADSQAPLYTPITPSLDDSTPSTNRRRDQPDPHAPRSFYEASQLLPVSKILVAPTQKGHVETARERELQLVITDLIQQNELLHAQRQALAQLHGVKDTGATALPETLGNFQTNSRRGQQLLHSLVDSTGHQPHQPAVLAQQQQAVTAEKQNALLAKVNEYLQAYRAARKAAALHGPQQPANQSNPASPAAPFDPLAESNSLARNVVAGQKNLLFNSRFVSLLKGGGGANTSRTFKDDDGERKEQPITHRGSQSSRPSSSSASSIIPGSSHVTFQTFSLSWLIKWVRSIYDAKLIRDDLCRKENLPLQPFPEFILELQRKKYGLETISGRKTWDIIQSLMKYRDTDKEIGFFIDFLEESRSLDELILFLRTRAVVLMSTVGIRWPGYINERSASSKSCSEYISLCRARDVISTIFSTSPSMQDDIYREILAASITWNQLPDPIAASRWDTLLPTRQMQVDERCILLTDFLERILNQFRAIELQLRHQQWAEDLFNSAIATTRMANQQQNETTDVNLSNDRMDFASFQQVFSLAEPRYSPREIASLYSNVTRNAGLKTLSKQLFKQLIHNLMNEGVMFPLLKHAGYEAASLVRMIIRHWNNFKEFFEYLYQHLSHSEKVHDIAAANHLRQIRFALEKEIARAASGSAISESDESGDSMSSLTRRLVSIYRGLLNVISNHQSAFMMVPLETPIQLLHTELKTMQHIILQRQRLHDTNEARVDSWLERIATLDTDERVAETDPPRPITGLLRESSSAATNASSHIYHQPHPSTTIQHQQHHHRASFSTSSNRSQYQLDPVGLQTTTPRSLGGGESSWSTGSNHDPTDLQSF